MRLQLGRQRGRAVFQRGIYLPVRPQDKPANIAAAAQSGERGRIGGDVLAHTDNGAGQRRMGLADTLQFNAGLWMKRQHTKARWQKSIEPVMARALAHMRLRNLATGGAVIGQKPLAKLPGFAKFNAAQ